MIVLFHKTDYTWSSVDSLDGIDNVSDYLQDPIYADGEFDRCQALGPSYWVFTKSGENNVDTIRCMTDTEIDTNARFLADAKRKKFDDINNYRDNIFLKSGGFYFQNNFYECDNLAKINITGTVATIVVGVPLPSDFTWRSKDNQNIQMDAQTVTKFGVSMGGFVAAIFSWSWQLKEKVDSLTTVSAVTNFNHLNYWPNNNYDGTGPQGTDTTTSTMAAATTALANDYP